MVNNKRPRDNLNPKVLGHYRLGHIGDDRISKLERDGLLGSLGSKPYPTCESYILGKMTKWPFVGQEIRATELLGFIYSNVCRPINVIAWKGYQYFITMRQLLQMICHRIELLRLVHLDVCGPINVIARGGYQYFITMRHNFYRWYV